MHIFPRCLRLRTLGIRYSFFPHKAGYSDFTVLGKLFIATKPHSSLIMHPRGLRRMRTAIPSTRPSFRRRSSLIVSLRHSFILPDPQYPVSSSSILLQSLSNVLGFGIQTNSFLSQVQRPLLAADNKAPLFQLTQATYW